ncbi:MAG TPA: type IV toxin-antitoxin system AbiEi family antitoxin domain-containing protein [Kiritimatiellia bacterium]|nr:type IV toxin-antitoxin system AbiEi family antitoxin domain-containing protein [Kiritimatiellia bacterium]
MGTSSKELARKLRALAAKQHGCFTAAQAVETGYADSVHLYHMKNGKWIRVFRGVYRFADAPETPEARCLAALLWTRDKNGKIQGFLPAETAEKLRSGTFPADKPVRVLVPRGFRRSSEAPEGIEIEFFAEKSHKTSKMDGLTFLAEPPQASARPSRAHGAPLDAPDYYDWLDYQAVLCEKTS